MCGIVGAVAQRDIAEILLEGLRRLEYRGYDSAGLAVVDAEGHMTRLRRLGKVQMLARPRKNTRCTVAPVLRIPAGRHTANRLKATRTRMCLNTSWSCITALSKTTNRCAKTESARLYLRF